VEEKKRSKKRTAAVSRATTSSGSGAGSATRSKKARSATPPATRARPSSPTPKRKSAGTGAGKRSVPPPTSAAKPDPTAARRAVAKQTAIAVAVAALDKKAERVEIVDIGEKVDYADYLVVMTGRSDRQVIAIAHGIEEALEKRGTKTVSREGLQQGHWVLIDYGDVIVHVFLDEARKYYDLEGLWMDAPRVPTPSFVPPPPVTSSGPFSES
jgi:ribosome-associated protein